MIEKVDNVWMRKDLAQWPLPRSAETCMASYNDVWVVLELDIDTLRVYTGSDDGKELKMPVSGNGLGWGGMSMSLPFLFHFTFEAQGSRTCMVMQVFKVPTDKDIGTDPSLLKSINIDGFLSSSLRPFHSTLVVGVGVLYLRQTVGTILHVFEKAKLQDAGVLPENIERRKVKLEDSVVARLSSLNTTSLVYIKRDSQDKQLHRRSLVKRNFWMSNSKSE